MSKHCVVLNELYLCETFLIRGYAPYVEYGGLHIPPYKKKEYISDMRLVLDKRMRRWYTEEPDLIFKYYVNRYGKEIEKYGIASYDQLVYKMRESRWIH